MNLHVTEEDAVETLVAVLGLGHVGLPTAAILATHGVHVVGVDVSSRYVEAVNRGSVPFVEPDLEIHVAAAVAQGTLRAQHETPRASAYIVAVPTPFREGHRPDLSFVESAVDSIIPLLEGGELVLLESTSPPGTTRHIAQRVMAARPDLSVDGSQGRPMVQFAHAPERVLPGQVMVEMVTNDRVIGGLTPAAAERARDLYAVFCKAQFHLTDATTAEMCKLVENSFRDVNIAFANELSLIADRLGFDVWELIDLANNHPRVQILQPGPGVGGHCIAVDPWFIVDAAPDESQLIRAAREVNDRKPAHVVEEVLRRAARFREPVIAAFGLAFKADIEDVRESPAVAVVEALAKALPEGEIQVVEPHVSELPSELRGCANVSLAETDDALDAADLVLLLVDHQQFQEIDRSRLEGKVLVDTRGAWR